MTRKIYTGWPVVEGYADRQSYLAGDVVEVHCSSRASSVTAVVSKVGRERVEVWRREGLSIGEHPYPRDAYASGCGWPVAFAIETDASWPSGFYEVSLRAEGQDDEASQSEAFFVIRPHASTSADGILVLATNTYNAYNQWGGKCLYSGAVKMSFDRPLERGYLRRQSAPDEVSYDGRVNSLVDPPDEEHHQMQQYLADFDYPM